MVLQSQLFRGDAKLEAAAVSDPAHVVPGAVGPHVAKIQQALGLLDGAVIDSGELQSMRYGRSTAASVLAYKTKRNIINISYQHAADNIVGKMTMAALDKEMLAREINPPDPPAPPRPKGRCFRRYVPYSGYSGNAATPKNFTKRNRAQAANFLKKVEETYLAQANVTLTQTGDGPVIVPHDLGNPLLLVR
jgi:hypothetical protein